MGPPLQKNEMIGAVKEINLIIVPTLIDKLFEGFGLKAAQPAAALLILVVFGVLRRLAAGSTEGGIDG